MVTGRLDPAPQSMMCVELAAFYVVWILCVIFRHGDVDTASRFRRDAAVTFACRFVMMPIPAVRSTASSCGASAAWFHGDILRRATSEMITRLRLYFAGFISRSCLRNRPGAGDQRGFTQREPV